MSEIKIDVPEEMYLMKPNLIEVVVKDNEIKIDNVYAKAIWNAAIEAAIELVGPIKLQEEIRKLKK